MTPAIELPQAYQRVAVRIARGFQTKLPRNVLREDLEQAALEGLADGLRKLAERGQSADNGESEWYLRTRIRGNILDWLRAEDWLPRRARCARPDGSQPRAATIVRMDDVGPHFEEHLEASGATPEEQAIANVDRELILAATASLPPRLQRIVRLHYTRGAKFLDIARELGCSEPRISQLHARAIGLLREHLSALKRSPRLSALEGASDSMEGEATSEPSGPHRATRSPQSGSRPAPPFACGVRASRLGAPTAPSAHRPGPRGGRGAEPGGPPRSDCYRVAPRGARVDSARDAAEDIEPEPEWFYDVDWQRADRGGVAMSAEARALVPVSSVLPEEGLDLVAEVKRYQLFLIEQALLRTGNNKAQAAQLLGLNRTTLVEMIKRLEVPERAPEPVPVVSIQPLHEQLRPIILETIEQCGGNRTRAARALGIGHATMYRYLYGDSRAKVVHEAPDTHPPDTLPGAQPVAPPIEPAPTSEPAPPSEQPPEPPESEPIGAPPAPQALKSEPPTGVYLNRVSRSAVARLRAAGLTRDRIAIELGVSVWAVDKVLRSPAPLAKCGTREDDPARAG